VEESTAEQPSGRKRSDLAKAFAARLRNPGGNGSLVGRLVTAGVAVVVAGALAVGIGAVVYHKSRPPKTVNAADARRSPTSLRTTLAPTSGAPQPPHPSLPHVSPGRTGKKAGPSAKSPHAGGKAGGNAVHAGPMRAAAAPVRSIVSYASGRCIDVTDGSSAPGTPLQIWDCSGAAWQEWAFESDGTMRTLGKCMTVAGGSSADGAAIELDPCNGGAAQRFNLNTSWDLVNIAADKCVDVKDKQTANGTRLQLWQCAGTSNQKWHQG
jgi:hypothetical protein